MKQERTAATLQLLWEKKNIVYLVETLIGRRSTQRRLFLMLKEPLNTWYNWVSSKLRTHPESDREKINKKDTEIIFCEQREVALKASFASIKSRKPKKKPADSFTLSDSPDCRPPSHWQDGGRGQGAIGALASAKTQEITIWIHARCTQWRRAGREINIQLFHYTWCYFAHHANQMPKLLAGCAQSSGRHNSRWFKCILVIYMNFKGLYSWKVNCRSFFFLLSPKRFMINSKLPLIV